MARVLLISENNIKHLSLINNNVDANYIEQAIVTAQDMGLQPLIGTNLFQKLCTLVENGTIINDANSYYKALIDYYIMPYLCEKVMADIPKMLFAKFRNAGMTQSSDQQTAQLSRQDVEYIVSDHNYKADFYAKRLTDRLCASSEHYPEWRDRRDVADMPANSEPFNTHIVL